MQFRARSFAGFEKFFTSRDDEPALQNHHAPLTAAAQRNRVQSEERQETGEERDFHASPIKRPTLRAA